MTNDSPTPTQGGFTGETRVSPDPVLPGAASTAVVRQALEDISDILYRMGRRLGSGEDRLRDLAHEIRTPMSALVVYTDMLSKADSLNLTMDQIKDYGATVHEAALRIVQTTERTLDEHVTGESDSRTETVDFARFSAVVLKAFTAQAKAQGVAIEANIDPDFPRLAVDRVALERVITNLVANALKFTPKGGRVTLRAKLDADDKAMIVVISDTGQGFPAEILLKIERGEVIEPSGKGAQGWGRGLNIVRELLQRMGATLHIQNVEGGAGAIAMIRFPPACAGGD